MPVLAALTCAPPAPRLLNFPAHSDHVDRVPYTQPHILPKWRGDRYPSTGPVIASAGVLERPLSRVPDGADRRSYVLSRVLLPVFRAGQ